MIVMHQIFFETRLCCEVDEPQCYVKDYKELSACRNVFEIRYVFFSFDYALNSIATKII